MDSLPEPLPRILPQVSRSFALSLGVLPRSLRGPLGLAYLLARAADTIADTRIVPREERLRSLDILRRALDARAATRLAEIADALTGAQRIPAERELLLHLPACVAALDRFPPEDRARIRQVLRLLLEGMQNDLRTFPGEDMAGLAALEIRKDLHRYTYYAAGCVGEFWTEMAMAHRPACAGWVMNFLALLGWAPDGETTLMDRDELVARFSLERVGSSPATFDYAKLDWMNGVYLRALPPEQYGERLVGFLCEQGSNWPEERIREAVPLVQEKIGRLGEFPGFAGFLFHEVEPDPSLLDARILDETERALAGIEPWTADEIESALKQLCDDLGEKPRTVYLPIRVAVTGSRVSPGLYESLQLLGKDVSLERLRAGAEAVS